MSRARSRNMSGISPRAIAMEPHRTLHHIEKPSLLASEPGGDGLTIYRLEENGSLIFRLWEVKKATGQGPLSRIITRACNQLAARGRQYLAKYASQAEHLPDEELVALYGTLANCGSHGTPPVAPAWRSPHPKPRRRHVRSPRCTAFCRIYAAESNWKG